MTEQRNLGPLALHFLRSRSCRERRPETMKINHEETDSHRSSLFFLRILRFFVVDFRRSRSCRERRPETMKKCGAGFQPAPHACCGQVGNLPHTFSEEKS